MCRRGNKHSDVQVQRITLVHFPSRDGKDAVSEGRDGWQMCLFAAIVGIFGFIVNMVEDLFRICTPTWRVKNYVSCQGKGINRRNESTIFIIMINVGTDNLLVS